MEISFGEQFAQYMRLMAVANMKRDQLADPLAMRAVLEVRDLINADPHNPVCEGLRQHVERLLGPQEWATGGHNA
ncbi:hypothetical protein [Paraburkholderia sp. C35]|uniref:hypothetical protein n=1 Tax=Paraburkholderia sp. C35 TaxID=2126993 RepID=UPI000D699B96|nr:hypothetical protein [Paraburkholderia sp. C35]